MNNPGYLPARKFLEDYENTELSLDIKRLSEQYLQQATRVAGPTLEDVQNGVKSFLVAQRIMQREQGDGVTELLDYPGFHQLFFYGDFQRELRAYCRLYGLEAQVV